MFNSYDDIVDEFFIRAWNVFIYDMSRVIKLCSIYWMKVGIALINILKREQNIILK
jgi:hypothetical protein